MLGRIPSTVSNCLSAVLFVFALPILTREIDRFQLMGHLSWFERTWLESWSKKDFDAQTRLGREECCDWLVMSVSGARGVTLIWTPCTYPSYVGLRMPAAWRWSAFWFKINEHWGFAEETGKHKLQMLVSVFFPFDISSVQKISVC